MTLPNFLTESSELERQALVLKLPSDALVLHVDNFRSDNSTNRWCGVLYHPFLLVDYFNTDLLDIIIVIVALHLLINKRRCLIGVILHHRLLPHSKMIILLQFSAARAPTILL